MAPDVSLERHDLTRRLRAVLFVDIVESVRLMHADEQGTITRWRAFRDSVVAEELPPCQGRMVKHQGDGMLLEFESAFGAVQCALRMQERIAAGEAAYDPAARIQVRMAAHIADLVADDIDVYGDGVNLAARLRDLAGPGEILVSAAVRDHLTDGLDATLEDLGERPLRGIARPVRLFRAWPVKGPVFNGGPVGSLVHRPGIAVLPFRTPGGAADRDFLAEVLVDDLIGDLSRLTDLAVTSRLSTSRLRDRLFETRNIAELLGVRYLLSGTVVVRETRLRLTTELSDAEDGEVIWSQSFDRALGDMFDIEDELRSSIAAQIVPHLKNRELQRARAKRPENLTAYERVLRAVDHLHKSSPQELEKARALLDSAIALEPSYAAAYSWLARWHVLRVGQGWSPDPTKDAAEANRLAETAVDKDEMDPWSLSVRGLVAAYLNKDLQNALVWYERALTLNKSAVSAWVWSTSALAWLGEGEKAVEHSMRAIELSPLDPHMYSFTSIAGTAHAVAGQYDKAVELCTRSLRGNRMYASTHRLLTISLALAGRMNEARDAATELLKLEPTLTVSGFRARYPGNASEHTYLFCEALAEAGVPR